MRAPPAAFADVLKEHWRLKKDALLATWKEWGEQAPLRDSAHARVRTGCDMKYALKSMKYR
jgi:hypothetical protein